MFKNISCPADKENHIYYGFELVQSRSVQISFCRCHKWGLAIVGRDEADNKRTMFVRKRLRDSLFQGVLP